MPGKYASLLRPKPIFTSHQKTQGFTLLEVLITLVILAISFSALIKAMTENTQSIGYIQNKTIAHWVAENIVAQAQLGQIKKPNHGITQMLNQSWYWQLDFIDQGTAQKIKVTVRQQNHQDNLATLYAYIWLPHENAL